MKKSPIKLAGLLLILIVVLPLTIGFLMPLLGYGSKTAVYTTWTMEEAGCCVTLQDVWYAATHTGVFLFAVWVVVTPTVILMGKLLTNRKATRY